MQTIEIDFDVYKALTIKRRSENESYNDVLRSLLNLETASQDGDHQHVAGPGDWVTKGIRFPNGTQFRASYKGRAIFAEVKEGAMYLDGKKFSSASAAAMSITGTSVNGWVFWECRFPGQRNWMTLDVARQTKGA